jgi:hypothetical protein
MCFLGGKRQFIGGICENCHRIFRALLHSILPTHTSGAEMPLFVMHYHSKYPLLFSVQRQSPSLALTTSTYTVSSGTRLRISGARLGSSGLGHLSSLDSPSAGSSTFTCSSTSLIVSTCFVTSVVWIWVSPDPKSGS